MGAVERGEASHHVALQGREMEVGEVAGSLAVGVFADAEDERVGLDCAYCGFGKLCVGAAQLALPGTFFVKSNGGTIDYVVVAKTLLQGLEDGVVVFGVSVGYVSLP